jgi:hypothetical protein
MIVYLKHHEIDREQWDNCIRFSSKVKPYGFSWYLDIMAPGWEALIDDEYDSVFPIPGFKKYGIHYIATPLFVQQLGAFSPDKPPQNVINEFIEYLPDFYRLIDLCTGQRVDSDEYKVTLKVNYELDLSKPYEKLWSNFLSDCRRDIERSGRKKPEIVSDIKPGELIELFQHNRGLGITGIKLSDYQRLHALMDFCTRNRKGRILGVRTSRKKIIYGMFLVEIKGNKTMLFVANTPESRKELTGYYVVNELIKESAGTRTILDFEGSSIPSVAHFMESFGTTNVPYYRIYRNRLPWPIRMLKP